MRFIFFWKHLRSLLTVLPMCAVTAECPEEWGVLCHPSSLALWSPGLSSHFPPLAVMFTASRSCTWDNETTPFPAAYQRLIQILIQTSCSPTCALAVASDWNNQGVKRDKGKECIRLWRLWVYFFVQVCLLLLLIFFCSVLSFVEICQ